MSDKETKERLLESAKTEFSEKGFMKASLRTICKNAGVTTGALYFFFKDKEDLFAAIVAAPLNELVKLMEGHLSEDREIMSTPDWLTRGGTHEERHDDFAMTIVRHIYANLDVFDLLMTKAQGSKYENCVEGFVGLVERSYREMTEKAISAEKVDKYLLHWLSHIIIDAFVQLIVSEPDEKKAERHIAKILEFVINGWVELIMIPGMK